jgi:hypothetical protein
MILPKIGLILFFPSIFQASTIVSNHFYGDKPKNNFKNDIIASKIYVFLQ